MKALMIVLVLLLGALHSQAQARLEPGEQTFAFPDPTCTSERGLPVHLYVPKNAQEAPILFVLHGKSRNALGYRETWLPVARKHGALLVCPEFTDADYPRSERYNCGGLFGDDGQLTPEERWTFSVVERLFDEIRMRASNPAARYLLYGHSAGAQFVHRLVLLLPNARFERAVAANAGWYTFPSTDSDFPYGFGRLGALGNAEDRLQQALGRELIVLLGEHDTDSEDPDLRTTPEAMAQGEHRLARGQRFVAAGHAAAEQRQMELAWRLVTVKGAAHSNEQMARAAAEELFAPRVPVKKKR